MSRYLYSKLDEEKVFKDPVHRYVHVNDQLIWDLINAPEFQRLRRIRQLGTSYLTFHGAEHSRFNHSLGVYELMRRILEKFMAPSSWGTEEKLDWGEEERLLSLAAALLHDVGHGPFSHSFEKVFGTNHETWTQHILLGDTSIHRLLREVSEEFPQKVHSVIAKTGDAPLVESFISSQIDVDRMDYLLRDAYYAGVSYGHFDLERILRVMRLRNQQVVFKYSGMHAVEDYIMARYQMYWQVYFHPVTRSAEVILNKIFLRLRDLYKEGYSFACPPHYLFGFLEGTMTLEEYLALDEHVMFYYFQMWRKEEDRILADLCDRFINRRLFKYVQFDPRESELKEELKQLFDQAGVNPRYYLEFESTSDLPYDYYRPGQGERRPIYLLMPGGQLEELSRVSKVVKAISGETMTDHKIYFAQDLLDEKERGKTKGVVTLIKTLLNEAQIGSTRG